MKFYLLFWLTLIFIALVILIRDRPSFEILKRPYFRFLFVPWKVATFLVAGAVMTLAAPYSGDYTWDYIDAAVMSVMTFLTAPWTTGVLYKFIKGKESFKTAYVALCTAMFSFSWFYDGYIFLRDGFYPHTWLHNIVLSSMLYFSAGLLWNLEPAEKRTVAFSFERDGWPEGHPKTGFKEIFLASMPFLLFGAFVVGMFVMGYFLG
jgi:hypothetical protein